DKFENLKTEVSNCTKCQLSQTRKNVVFGEAASKFKKANVKFELTHIQQIISFRNRIIHAYDSIDDSIVWAIVKNHLPALKSETEKLLKK
ncbi:unnamed protein product, partial [marine sediment metagenome]